MGTCFINNYQKKIGAGINNVNTFFLNIFGSSMPVLRETLDARDSLPPSGSDSERVLSLRHFVMDPRVASLDDISSGEEKVNDTPGIGTSLSSWLNISSSGPGFAIPKPLRTDGFKPAVKWIGNRHQYPVFFSYHTYIHICSMSAHKT